MRPAEPVPFDPEIAEANRIFSRTVGEGEQSGLLHAGLSWHAGQLMLVCAHADLLALDKLEAGRGCCPTTRCAPCSRRR